MKKILFIGYSVTLVALTIFSYAFIDQHLLYYASFYSGFAFINRLTTTALYCFFIVLLFIFYFLFIRLLKQKKLSVKDIKVLIGMTCLLLLFSYPAMLSYDIFNYIATAKVLFFYHENPFVIMPIAFLGDPLLAFTHAANKVALYGPVWIVLTGVPYLLGGGNFFLTVMSFKILVVLFYLLTLFVLWQFTKNPSTILLFGLNPLVVLETLTSNHNDIVMMFFTLFAFLLIKQKKYLFAFCFFVLSILIKYATIFLLPVFLFTLWQSYRQKTIDWKKSFFFSTLAMLAIFFLSPLREELYPWYAIWFLPFAFLTEKKILLYFSIAMSFGLLLRYIPFMYLGTYFGPTPLIRIVVTGIPLFIAGLLLLFQHKLLKKR